MLASLLWFCFSVWSTRGQLWSKNIKSKIPEIKYFMHFAYLLLHLFIWEIAFIYWFTFERAKAGSWELLPVQASHCLGRHTSCWESALAGSTRREAEPETECLSCWEAQVSACGTSALLGLRLCIAARRVLSSLLRQHTWRSSFGPAYVHCTCHLPIGHLVTGTVIKWTCGNGSAVFG